MIFDGEKLTDSVSRLFFELSLNIYQEKLVLSWTKNLENLQKVIN